MRAGKLSKPVFTRTNFIKSVVKVVSRAIPSLFVAAFSIQAANAENLLDIYQLALVNDPSINAAEANYEAGQTIDAQALARLLPQIDANYTRSRNDSSSQSARSISSASFPPSDRDNVTDSESYSVSLTQEIFNAAAFFGYRQAKASSKQAELRFNIEQQDLILRVSEAYFNVLRGINNLSSARAEEKAIAQQLEQTQQRYEVGLIAITDVHEAQAAYDLAIATRLTEEVQLGVAYESLSVITGNQHNNLYTLSENFPINKPSPENPENWVSFATENNISIQLAEETLKAANQNAHVKSSAFLPTVQAVGRYSKSDSDTEVFDNVGSADGDIFTPGNQPIPPGPRPDEFAKDETTVVELKVSLPIFSGGARWAERKQAGYERVAEQANLVAAKRQALQQTRSSYLTTVTDTARVNARAKAIVSAQSALEATQAGYDAGTRNIVDLLNAQRDLYRARKDYGNTRYDYVINSLKLKQAAGIIGPKDIGEINKWLEPAEPVLYSETSFNQR